MNTRHCMLCGFEKEDISEHLCVECKADQVKVAAEVVDKKLPYWEAEALRQSARDSRRKVAGMAGRTDPRQLINRIDTTELQARGLI